MSNIIEAYEALEQSKLDGKERKVSWCSKKVRLFGGYMEWANGERVGLYSSYMRGWKIEEPEPEKEYVDCPVFNNAIWVFEYRGQHINLSDAPNLDLIGYVYENGVVHNQPTIAFGGKCLSRCVAVRIAKGE